jgi:hypothetical protein|tara:strand:- start:1585 stop:2184 length:600 start_codon:yes stop_codon:yes gene_type:complete
MTRIAILALLLLLPAGASAGKGQGAFWRSLLVPGWGQRYATGGGGRFFAAELAFWGGYLGFERLREVRRDQYRAFAAAHADARPQGKDGEYFDDLGFYQSRLEHNQFARYEDGPEAAIYPLGRDFFWEWDRQASRERYRQLRNSTAGAGRQALFMTGLVAVNHLFAAIHAARTASGEVRTDIVPVPERGGAALLLVHRF